MKVLIFLQKSLNLQRWRVVLSLNNFVKFVYYMGLNIFKISNETKSDCKIKFYSPTRFSSGLFSSGGSEEESTSKFIEFVGQIQFIVIVGLRFPFPL